MKNKQGISLIVLIVTIIVIIILAAAVILTLNNNNPIDSSRVAQLSENRNSINSALTLYLGKVMAQTQGQYDAGQIITGKDSDGNSITTLAQSVLVTSDAPISTTSTTSTTYYKLNSDSGKNTTLDVAIPSITSASWYVNTTDATVYLVYENNDKAPSWIKNDTTAKTFVKCINDGKIADLT